MRLLNFKVTNYRCVDDSGVIDVDPKVTCLVGKNESETDVDTLPENA